MMFATVVIHGKPVASIPVIDACEAIERLVAACGGLLPGSLLTIERPDGSLVHSVTIPYQQD